MITTRFKEIVWTGGVCAAALAFYMISQTVAAKRAELAAVERRIAATQQEIRLLHTEIDTRGGLAQIESWNQRVYGLQAPGAEQFMTSSVKLAALTQPGVGSRGLPLDPAIVASHGAVDRVSMQRVESSRLEQPTKPDARPAPASPPLPALGQPVIRTAAFVQATPSALAPATPPSVHAASLQKPAKMTLGDDFLADLGDEGSAAHTRKVRP